MTFTIQDDEPTRRGFPSPGIADAEAMDWSAALHRALHDRLGRMEWDPDDRDDIAASGVEYYLSHTARCHATFEGPEHLAVSMVRNLQRNWRRQMRRQRGEGSDLIKVEGDWEVRRPVVAIDSVEIDHSCSGSGHSLQTLRSLSTSITDRIASQALCRQVLESLSSSDRNLLVDTYIGDVASELLEARHGVAGAALRQRQARARRRARQRLEDLGVAGAS